MQTQVENHQLKSKILVTDSFILSTLSVAILENRVVESDSSECETKRILVSNQFSFIRSISSL